MAGTALIFGISGQDGSLLARHLLTQGWTVYGTSRDAELNELANLTRLGIRNSVTVHSANPIDFRSVIQVIECTAPDHVYNLGGQSSVGLSFEQPIETYESIVVATLNILESIRFLKRSIRFYNAASSEYFGDTKVAADETTPFHPRSPYAVAKSAAFWAVANYRDAYRLFAASGILFNHESPLRSARFVTQKVIRAAADIAMKEGRSRSSWAISTSGAIGVGLMNMPRRCISFCDMTVRRTSLLQRGKASHWKLLSLKRSLHLVSTGGRTSFRPGNSCAPRT
jgi:GDPmannose 4,6-dehydratase